MAPRSFSQSGNRECSSIPKHVGRNSEDALNFPKSKDSREHGSGTNGELRKNKTLSLSSPISPPHLNGSGVHTPHPSHTNDSKSMRIKNGRHRLGEGSPGPPQNPTSHMSNPDGSQATYTNHKHHQKGKKGKHFKAGEGEGDEGEDARDGGSFKQRKETKLRRHGHDEDDQPSTHESNKRLKTGASQRISSVTSSSFHHKGKKMDSNKNKVEVSGSNGIFLKRKEQKNNRDRQEEKAEAVRSSSSSSSPHSDGFTGEDDGGYKQNRKKHFQKPSRGDPLSAVDSSSSSSTPHHTKSIHGPSGRSPSGRGTPSSSCHPYQKSPFYRAPKTEEDRIEERKRSVFVTQLPVDAETEEIQRLFSRFGDIATIKVVGGGGGGEQGQGTSASSLTGRSQKRSAFVIFKEEVSLHTPLFSLLLFFLSDSLTHSRDLDR